MFRVRVQLAAALTSMLLHYTRTRSGERNRAIPRQTAAHYVAGVENKQIKESATVTTLANDKIPPNPALATSTLVLVSRLYNVPDQEIGDIMDAFAPAPAAETETADRDLKHAASIVDKTEPHPGSRDEVGHRTQTRQSAQDGPVRRSRESL
jgi:hypothetical protein